MYEQICILSNKLVILIWNSLPHFSFENMSPWYDLKDSMKSKDSTKIGEKVILRKCGAIKDVAKSRCTKLHNDYQDDLSHSTIRLS